MCRFLCRQKRTCSFFEEQSNQNAHVTTSDMCSQFRRPCGNNYDMLVAQPSHNNLPFDTQHRDFIGPMLIPSTNRLGWSCPNKGSPHETFVSTYQLVPGLQSVLLRRFSHILHAWCDVFVFFLNITSILTLTLKCGKKRHIWRQKNRHIWKL
jgi:hypothetical protein